VQAGAAVSTCARGLRRDRMHVQGFNTSCMPIPTFQTKRVATSKSDAWLPGHTKRSPDFSGALCETWTHVDQACHHTRHDGFMQNMAQNTRMVKLVPNEGSCVPYDGATSRRMAQGDFTTAHMDTSNPHSPDLPQWDVIAGSP
jgi:hypothetical protein